MCKICIGLWEDLWSSMICLTLTLIMANKCTPALCMPSQKLTVSNLSAPIHCSDFSV